MSDVTPVLAPELPGTWFRGGTSKCWIFEHAILVDGGDPSAELSRLFGSPDVRQIDGLGGATSTTSKAMVVHSHDAHSLDYSFAQVQIDGTDVEWTSNCGNCASALALYAVEEGWFREGQRFAIRNRRNHTEQYVEVLDEPAPAGPAAVLPETGRQVRLSFLRESWSTYGATLPTGRPADLLRCRGLDLRTTLIDAGAPTAIVAAADLGLTWESGAEGFAERVELLRELRGVAGRAMRMPAEDLRGEAVPKVGVAYDTGDAAVPLGVRVLSMDAPHPAISLTSAVAVAVGAGTAGTVMHAITGDPPAGQFRVQVPSGIATMITATDRNRVIGVHFVRTARRLADARVYRRI